ncbi:MAG: hypothetical protein WD875_10305 [Pirellulales bacterium]
MTRSMKREITCGPLRIEFTPSGDRVAHTIYVAEENGGESATSNRPWRELMRSVERATDAAWPESPPLQELHFERRDGHDVALLVGRAGKSHWSASVGFETGTSGVALVFDVACRVSTRPVMVGSVYQVSEGFCWLGQQSDGGGDFAIWRSIVLLASEDSQWELAVDAPSKLIVIPTATRLSFRPSIDVDGAAATLRWRYVLRPAGVGDGR